MVASALLAGLVLLAGAGAGFAQQDYRVALVVGNSKYKVGGTLKNPVEDAAGMQVALHRLNFDLIVGQDLTLDQFKEKVREFTKRMKGADVALLFYAGHGVQFREQNYLLPTDVELKSEEDITGKTMRLNAILEDMGRYARVSVIFLDACRDSPQLRGVSRGPATGSLLEYMRGLATITASPADRFVGFAAAPGTVAEDGRGKNSPFTTALLRHISTPNLEIGAMFTAVRRDVIKITARRQQPESLNALQQPLYLRLDNPGGPPPVDPDPPTDDGAPPSISLSADAEFWMGIKDTSDPKNFEDYLQLFPKGRFVPLAKRKIDTLKVAVVKPPETKARINPTDLATFDGDFVMSTGIARITKTHPKEEALRSARALARARAIVSKLPASTTVLVPNFAGSSSDAAELLGHMSRGITHEEMWTLHETGNNVVKVDLRAKVRMFAGENDRKLTGSIEPAEVIAGQPYRLKLAAKKDATVGVFAWQADGTVVRLYPENPTRPVLIKSGETVSFPRAGDAYPAIATQNLPKERRNHEALIVVTGSSNIAFEQLVPTAIAETVQHSSPDLLDGGDFLKKLAALPDAELEVLVLPYEVREK